MTTLKHVDYFLKPLNPKDSILAHIKEISEKVHKNNEAKESVNMVRQWVVENVKLLTGTTQTANLLTNPTFFMLEGALYLKAELALEKNATTKRLTPKSIKKYLSGIERNFISQLSIQLTLRSAADLSFAKRLSDARTEFLLILSSIINNSRLAQQVTEIGRFPRPGNVSRESDNHYEEGLLGLIIILILAIYYAPKAEDDDGAE